MIRNDMKLYKYRTINEYTLESIREQYIWMSNPSTFNDTFDCRRIYDYYGDVDKNITVFCMSDSFDNHLLWGYYADGYRGICIEYDLPNQFPFCFENLSYPFFPVCKPVRYVRDMPLMEDKPPYILSLREKKILLENYIFTKNAEWSHEKEWRFAIFYERLTQNIHKLKLPLNTISAIYLGCDICEEHKNSVYNAIRHIENINLYQMKRACNSFDIEANPLPRQRPWIWKYLTEREKELARKIDKYLVDNKSLIDVEDKILISQLMADIGADQYEQDFIIDRIRVNNRLIKAWESSTDNIIQVENLLKTLKSQQ